VYDNGTVDVGELVVLLAEDFDAIDRLVQLVKATKEDNSTFAQNLANEDSTSFMKYWLLHLNSVTSFCGGTDKCNIRPLR